MRKAAIALAVLLLGTAGPVERLDAQGGASLGFYERFDLFTNCSPLVPSAGVQWTEAEWDERDELQKRLNAMMESRVRAARLYISLAESLSTSTPYLGVWVQIVGPAFGYEVRLRKLLYDEMSDEEFLAPTWATRGIGVYDDTDYIVQGVSEALDQFINEYLRVNEGAC